MSCTEELNKKCFISNPFSQAINDRLYKTGDLVIQDKEGNLHYLGRIDTQIKIRGSPYYVNCETRLWETTHKKRTAAVHSLGFGGTNAHVIVQEAPDIKTTHSKGANVLVFSAKTEQSLQASLHALYGYILNVMRKNSAELHLADLAYTLQLGRQQKKLNLRMNNCVKRSIRNRHYL